MRWLLTTLSALALGLLLGRSTRAVETYRPARDGRVGPVGPPSTATIAPAPRPTPSPLRLVFGAVMIVFGVIAMVYFSFRLRDVITLGLVSLLLAVGLQGPVAYLHKLGLPRPIGLLAIYVVVIAGLVLAGWLLLPPVYRDLRAFATESPRYLDEAQRQLDRVGVSATIPNLPDVRQRVLSEVTSDVGSSAGRALSILSFVLGLFGGIFNLFFLLVLSVFIVMEGPAFRNHVLSLLPPDRERQWQEITSRIAVKIQGWMRGTLFLGLTVGSVITVGLLVLGMPYPFLLGLLAGIGELIPMIGPIVAAVPAVAISGFYGYGMFGTVLLLYILNQQLENYLLVPRIMGSTVDLPGLVVLVAFLIGTELMGVTGGILAMPVAAIFQVLWLDLVVPAIRRGRADRTPVDVQVNVQAGAAAATGHDAGRVRATAR